VVNELDRDSASSIAILQETYNDSNELKALKTNLANINANLSFVMQSITELVKTINLVLETIKEICNIQDKLNKITGSETDAVKQKCFSKTKVICGI
jgi:uncharacterized coiled-coil DUF342 family protein